MYKSFGKRLMDVVLSLMAIILFSLVLVIVAVLVRIKLGRPVIFRQDRPGKDEKVFTLYKFRTMIDARDDQGELLPDSERLTGFGHMLRSTSLDELPELFNILKGDMSIVGPRPLRIEYLPYYSEEQRRRHSVLPGLTGLAQIKGRNAIMWDERFAYDIEYVDNITFLTDLQIILATIKKVLLRDDIGARLEEGSDEGVEDFDSYAIRKQMSGDYE
ncbi:MAG TPA: sugar transferase [Syntrophomonadaceae bacterium]|jgi:lipopolysaccharide/colanic/teichoic acid biosynthesis glycosyltransferase|nr:sugar transferase [Syntrophomonadaceae bacterium]